LSNKSPNLCQNSPKFVKYLQ